jgi:hypothetical protein
MGETILYFSIVVPTYDQPQQLRTCLEALSARLATWQVTNAGGFLVEACASAIAGGSGRRRP